MPSEPLQRTDFGGSYLELHFSKISGSIHNTRLEERKTQSCRKQVNPPAQQEMFSMQALVQISVKERGPSMSLQCWHLTSEKTKKSDVLTVACIPAKLPSQSKISLVASSPSALT